MNTLIRITFVLLAVALLGGCSSSTETAAPTSGDIVELGRNIFNDVNLSNPAGQSCASCHAANTGFSDPNHAIVSPGVVPGLFGDRNAPSIGYAAFTPTLHFDNVDSTWVGGQFLDGRVNTLEEQAQKPFLNHLEMNDTSVAQVVAKLRAATYFPRYVDVFGNVSNDDSVFVKMSEAIAAFERTSEFARFTSKYDYYLKGEATLTAQEMRGLALFNDTATAMCANCHISTPDEASGKVLFTDFTYDNIGVPKNPNNPFYMLPAHENPDGAAFLDRALGGFLKNADYDGQFKVPSLRNVAISAPYFHNGFFNTLEEVVHWYNVRDSATTAGAYPPAEIGGNVNAEELGNLKLSTDEEADIVAFLKTLTDGYK